MRNITGRSRLMARLRSRRHPDDGPSAEQGQGLAARVAALEEAVEESRQLNQRLADVVDVVTEVLVPPDTVVTRGCGGDWPTSTRRWGPRGRPTSGAEARRGAQRSR